jgi:hypothetical protein
VTVIEQNACGSVVTVARAVRPREIGPLTVSVMSSAPMTLSILMGGGSAVIDAVVAVATAALALAVACGVLADFGPLEAHPSANKAAAMISVRASDELINPILRELAPADVTHRTSP